MDKIINILLLTIIFVFDPLAIALVIAANFAFEQLRGKTKENIYGETVTVEEEEAFDEDHALDLVMNDMVEDLTPEDISKIVEESEKESEPNEDLKEATSSYKEFINPIDNLKKDTSRRGVDIDGDGTIDGYDNTGDGLIDEPRPASSKRAQYVMNEKPFYARPNFNWGDRSKWINNQNAVNYWLTYIKNEKDTNYPDNFDSKTY